MFSEIIILGVYGLFVWPAFIFTFTICLVFYLNVRKEFKKNEKIYLSEFKQTYPVKIKTLKEKEGLSSRPIF